MRKIINLYHLKNSYDPCIEIYEKYKEDFIKAFKYAYSDHISNTKKTGSYTYKY
jgi:ABC-type sulfate transport system substrate-binding protein